MSIKTENQAEDGLHAFERAGLGKAPFDFVGCSEEFITYPDGTQQASGCCDYCYNGIRYVCHIKSADGRRFKVGCNCVDKVGDKGIIRAYKTSPEFRKIQREKRQAKGRAAREIVEKLVEENRERLAAHPHPLGFKDRQTGAPLTLLDQVLWMKGNCGTSGITSYAKTLQRIINQLPQPEHANH